jgi:D-sedoheptulose 7-phosphate isomerase
MNIKIFQNYSKDLISTIQALDYEKISTLVLWCQETFKTGNQVFICGNGGSAANAMHIANDLIYGANPKKGLNVEALSANAAILTCLANDTGYENIFAQQLIAKANHGDVLIVLSGSGNSANILKAMSTGAELGLKTCAIVGFDGGKAKTMADLCLHANVSDMQVAEDIQVIVGHMIMKGLKEGLSS